MTSWVRARISTGIDKQVKAKGQKHSHQGLRTVRSDTRRVCACQNGMNTGPLIEKVQGERGCSFGITFSDGPLGVMSPCHLVLFGLDKIQR